MPREENRLRRLRIANNKKTHTFYVNNGKRKYNRHNLRLYLNNLNIFIHCYFTSTSKQDYIELKIFTKFSYMIFIISILSTKFVDAIAKTNDNVIFQDFLFH